MSREIGSIKTMRNGDDLYVTTFYGGHKYGKSIQLTIRDKYCELTRDSVVELIVMLKGWLE